MKTMFSCFPIAFAVAFAASAFGQSAYVYPAKNQNPQQVEKDKQDCAAWATQQTGFDPSKPVVVAAPPPQQGQVVQGGARGAAVGAVGGAIGGDAGKGAAIGAASGALIGGMRRRDDAQNQQAQQQAAVNQAASSYNRAYKACLEGKGYTVQ